MAINEANQQTQRLIMKQLLRPNTILSKASQWFTMAVLQVLFAVEAWAGIPIGGTTKDLENLITQYIDFLRGPFANTVILSSIISGMLAWLMFPKEGFVALAARLVVAGVVLANAMAIAKSLTFKI